MTPGPATKDNAPEQVKWEPEVGGKVQQQQLQGSGNFKGNAKDSQACGVWEESLHRMER